MIGSAVADVIIDLEDHLPRTGEDIHVRSQKIRLLFSLHVSFLPRLFRDQALLLRNLSLLLRDPVRLDSRIGEEAGQRAECDRAM